MSRSGRLLSIRPNSRNPTKEHLVVRITEYRDRSISRSDERSAHIDWFIGCYEAHGGRLTTVATPLGRAASADGRVIRR
jgi:hypothetical protein